MDKSSWIKIFGFLAVAILVLAMAPATMAQGPGDSGTERVAPLADGEGRGPGDCRRGGPRGGGHVHEAVAEALGMTPEELRDALDEETSIADVAAEQGVSLDSVVEAAVAPIAEKLAERVEAGDMTQEEADAKLDEARERLTEKFQEPFSRPRAPRGRSFRPNFDGGGPTR